ncbi:MAG: flagellar hook capping FlgD N-terminal domain-containing protein [Terracidiphilus sp.]|nr:flagellar hook capping FlgD N-terminal domain-containing protein [Terracidiphilus sp.]
MSAITGLLNHQSNNSSLTTTLATNASSSSSDSTTGSDAATISANDFLVLLVTEMKNQDPTASTDPNEYINQLVNVNSLQQLVSINQTLTNTLGASSTSTSSSATKSSNQAATVTANSAANLQPSSTTARFAGNIGIQKSANSSERISTALSNVRS